jgi:serine/threonine-protein kinase
VLDFGLAKAFVGDDAALDLSAPTVTTREGLIAGTPAYMSPEQARGQTVDKRTDIWAFGCVLYEMLTARPAFPSATISDTIAAVLDREPDWRALSPKTPAAVRRLLQRCLEKDGKRRWHVAADVRIEIEATLADPQGVTLRLETVAAHQPVWRRVIPYAATALAAAAIATTVDWSARPEPAAAITRFSIVLPDGRQLTRLGRHNIAVSPDGQNIVYVADNQLYLRPMGDVEARPIPGTNQDVNTPFFSPDGQWIGFYAVPEGRLKKIAITGGASVTIADLANPFGANWEADDRILVGQGSRGIVRVSANGGLLETIVKLEAGETADGPQMLPDGEHVLVTVTNATGAARWDQARIVVQSLRSGERTVLINGGSDARYVPTGHIVYALRTNLLAVPFDERSLTVTGGPVPILAGIGRSAQTNDTAAMFFSFSSSGALAYFVGVNEDLQTTRSLALVDRKGKSVALPMPPLQYDDPRISPDGTQLAVRINTENESNIWIYDLTGVLAPRRLTFGGTNTSPAWAPDSRRIAFISNRDDNRNAIFWQPADGSGSAERLTDLKAAQPLNLRFSPDGKIVYRDAHGDGSLWILPVDGDRKPQLVIDSAGNQFDPSFSPDGRWIAYGSNESRRNALYVQPYPPTGAKYQITAANAFDPLWSPNGRQIFWIDVPPDVRAGWSLGALMSVDVRTGSGITYANQTRVFDSVLVSGNWPYDVTPDGSRFVVLLRAGGADPDTAPNPEIRVTLNWFEELRQRVPR